MSEPRERPILFSGEMVRAILDGRKTMTRRVVKCPDYVSLENGRVTTWDEEDAEWRKRLPDEPNATKWMVGDRTEGQYIIGDRIDGDCGLHSIHCPYGNVGDRLWVRETAWYDKAFGDRVFFDGGDVIVRREGAVTRSPLGAAQTAEYMNLNGSQRRRPSIHMPRWASRLTLEITEVRVEQVQEISNEDCQAEGVTESEAAVKIFNQVNDAPWRQAFRELWDGLNVKRGYGWDANPWVWVIGFRREGTKMSELPHPIPSRAASPEGG